MSDDEQIAVEEGSDDEAKAVDELEEASEKADPDKPLSEDDVCQCVSLLCKTGDGISHAYVKLDARDRELTDVNILQTYIHLRYVDVSKNNLKDISALNALTHMLVLKADQNKLNSAQLDEMPYLQSASFNYNHIKTTSGLNHPQLEHLALNYNEITEISDLDPTRLSRLHTLELRGNKLTSTAGVSLPNLKNLFLGANVIKKVEGLDSLGHLSTLHLRDNQINQLDGFSDNMKNLQYLNLRGNILTNAKEAKKLQCLALLRAAVFKDNPCAAEDDYRLEMLIALRRLERLDKDEYNDDERQEAEEIYEQRRSEELTQKEEERKRALIDGAQEEIGSEGED